MPVNKRFLVLSAVTLILVLLAGCGGGGSLRFPPPQGGFTNANLNGTYAFSYTGSDGAGFLAVAGSFQADGNGHITAGTQDINSGFAIATNVAISGTYGVRADGRGSVTLNSSAGTSTIDFVLVAGGHGLVTRFDASAAGSGTIDLQTASAFSNTALAGTFAFNLAGIDAVGNPLAVAGNLTSNAAGTITAGVNDSNDNGTFLASDPVTGSIPVASSGRGTATLNTARGTLNFAFYVVDANHIKLVEVDNLLVLGGEAFRQTGPFSNASVNGSFAFTVAGADIVVNGPFAAGGAITSNGAGVVTGGVEDFNDAGTVTTNIGLTGSYSIAPSGRGSLTITSTAGTSNFVIYPSSGGVLVLQTDFRFVTTGAALAQQAGSFSPGSLSGTYGMNFTGVTTAGELDSIAQFTADGASRLTGIIDLNNNGVITFGQPLSGSFTVSANGRTVMPLQTPLGTQNMAVYLVDGTRALFVELDANLVAAGEMRHQ